jgi:D-alanine-D-alanine ligase
MKKLKVAVLMGGRSSERDVSLASGRNIVRSLDVEKYEAIPVEIGEDGRWLAQGPGLDGEHSVELRPGDLRAAGRNIDVVFIALHGRLGEDGAAQGLLEMMGIPYTGSGVLASALAMNKALSKKIFLQEGIPTNEFIDLRFHNWPSVSDRKLEKAWEIIKILGRPVVVKPACEGSSIGICIATTDKELTARLDDAFSYGEAVVVEKYLDAREIQCGVIGNKDPFALPLIEIVSKNQFFDFEAKYNPDLADEIVPAPIPDEETKRIQEISLRAYRAFGCSGFARVDTFLQEDGQVFVSEINTIPGMTEASLFPKEAQAAGIDFPHLLTMLIDLALEGKEVDVANADVKS